jgi:hypothetical protein
MSESVRHRVDAQREAFEKDMSFNESSLLRGLTRCKSLPNFR